MTLKRHLFVACSMKTIIMIFKSIGGNAVVTPISKGYKNRRDDGDAWLVLNVGAFHVFSCSQRIHPALVTTTELDSVSAQRNLALAVAYFIITDLNASFSFFDVC